MFKAPNTDFFPKVRKSSNSMSSLKTVFMSDEPPPFPRPKAKRRRTSEDFLQFCNLILEHENYEANEDNRRRHSSSPGSTGSTGSSSEGYSYPRENNNILNFHVPSEIHVPNNDTVLSDDENQEQITCYCGKPFAGRPMIECSSCLTWIHLKCARLRRGHIPDTWNCSKCQNRIKRTGSTKTKRLNKPISKNKNRPSSNDFGVVDGISATKSQRRKSQPPVRNAGFKFVKSRVEDSNVNIESLS